MEKLAALVERLSRGRVLVVGDIILDRYAWGRVERISPEAPVPVFIVEREEGTPGGAANVAAKAAELGAEVVLAGVLGDDAAGAELVDLTESLGVDASAVVRDPERPTTVKTRYMARNQQLLRADREETRPLSGPVGEAVRKAVVGILPSCEAVIIEDYAKGVLTRGVLEAALGRSGEVPTVVDPAGRDWARYRGAGLIIPNLKELEGAWGRPIRSESDVARAGRDLLEKSASRAIAATRGPEGMTLITRDGVENVPTVPLEVFDVTGAGDAVAACFALALAGGLALDQAAGIANLAGGVVALQLGAGRISREMLRSAALGREGRAASKIRTVDEAAALGWRARADGGRVVFTNGCFDLLHVGHIKLLEQAASRGGLLVVAINSDASVRRLKGPGRPVIKEAERARLIAALECVGVVVVFDDDTPERVIHNIKPDVLVKGAEYQESEIVGAEFVRSRGGEVVRVPLLEGVNTSALLERLRGGGGEAAGEGS